MNQSIAKSLTTIGLLLTTSLAWSQEDISERVQTAKQVTMSFAKELSGALKNELQSGGVTSAIAVCRDTAPVIANRLSLENGFKISRVGTRVRNSLLGTPDAWKQQVLADFRERAEKGEAYREISHAELVDEPDGRYFRFMKPIPVQDVCLSCHGGDNQISAPVRAALAEKYPHDQAVNYSKGDLRGAFTIKQLLSRVDSQETLQPSASQ